MSNDKNIAPELTDLQKNVAVRLVMGEPPKKIKEDFGVDAKTLSMWLKLQAFIDYKESLANSNREVCMQYLQSKQMSWLQRLDTLSTQDADLKVARASAVDLLGFAGMENKNTPAPPVMTQNNTTVLTEATEEEIDDELDELDDILANNESSGSDT